MKQSWIGCMTARGFACAAVLAQAQSDPDQHLTIVGPALQKLQKK